MENLCICFLSREMAWSDLRFRKLALTAVWRMNRAECGRLRTVYKSSVSFLPEHTARLHFPASLKIRVAMAMYVCCVQRNVRWKEVHHSHTSTFRPGWTFFCFLFLLAEIWTWRPCLNCISKENGLANGRQKMEGVWIPKLLCEGESPADLETHSGMRWEINSLSFKPPNCGDLLFSMNVAVLINAEWQVESDTRNRAISKTLVREDECLWWVEGG